MKHEFLPKGYLEYFKDVMSPILPSFFDTELTEGLLDNYMDILTDKNILKNKFNEAKTNKTSINKVICWLKWLEKSYIKQMIAHKEIVSFIESGTITTWDKYRNIEYKIGIEDSNLKEDNILRNLLEFVWDFNDSGNKMFKIEEQLTHELFNTEIKNVDESFLQLPFQCCGFYIPFNNKITVKGHLVKCVYISEFEENEGRLIKMLIVREDEAIINFNWVLKSGDIFKQIKQQLTEKYQTKAAYKDMQDILQFIIASLLYINSADAEKIYISIVKTNLNKERASSYPVCSLGNGLQINKRLYFTKSDTDEERQKREIFVLKWTVRGHFRNQPFGSGTLGKGKRLIWIRPFIKGRERHNEEAPIKPNFYEAY